MVATKIKVEALTHTLTIQTQKVHTSLNFPDRESISTINLGTHHYDFFSSVDVINPNNSFDLS